MEFYQHELRVFISSRAFSANMGCWIISAGSNAKHLCLFGILLPHKCTTPVVLMIFLVPVITNCSASHLHNFLINLGHMNQSTFICICPHQSGHFHFSILTKHWFFMTDWTLIFYYWQNIDFSLVTKQQFFIADQTLIFI